MGVDVEIVCVPREPMDEDSILAASRRLANCIGPEFFWVREGEHALYMEGGELHVNTLSRYYGIGYERGDFTKIAAVCDWLESECGEVFYGSDHESRENFRQWSSLRGELLAHWRKHGDVPYYGDSWMSTRFARKCGLCDVQMTGRGGGGRSAFFVCVYCGRRDRTTDDGKTWTCQRGKEDIDPNEKRAQVTR